MHCQPVILKAGAAIDGMKNNLPVIPGRLFNQRVQARKTSRLRQSVPASHAGSHPPEGFAFQFAVEDVGVSAVGGECHTVVRVGRAPRIAPGTGIRGVGVVTPGRIKALDIVEIKENATVGDDVITHEVVVTI